MDKSNGNPKVHTQKMQQRLRELMDHMREDIRKVDDPQFRALFETSAEVLGGVAQAMADYEKRNEAAWR